MTTARRVTSGVAKLKPAPRVDLEIHLAGLAHAPLSLLDGAGKLVQLPASVKTTGSVLRGAVILLDHTGRASICGLAPALFSVALLAADGGTAKVTRVTARAGEKVKLSMRQLRGGAEIKLDLRKAHGTVKLEIEPSDLRHFHLCC